MGVGIRDRIQALRSMCACSIFSRKGSLSSHEQNVWQCGFPILANPAQKVYDISGKEKRYVLKWRLNEHSDVGKYRKGIWGEKTFQGCFLLPSGRGEGGRDRPERGWEVHAS